ncbi:MAG: RecQ family ATP-dependent DNA helicase [Cyanophyceae cyanobacterium]
MTNSRAEDWHHVRAAFRQIWGYEEFRPPQDQIIRCLLAAEDGLIVLPTGGGKSLCFQLPAILQDGLTLVVSPLVALMENQITELQQRLRAALQPLPNPQQRTALLHSELPRQQRFLTLRALEQQQLKLLYLSPETLLSRPIWDRLKRPQVKINGLILDEAHCLVDWGTTFRPAYRRLGAVRPALLQHKPAGTQIAIAAFTATAEPTAQKIIQETLQLQSPQRFVASPYRPNLELEVKVAWTPRCRRHLLFKFVKGQGQQSGLIYVRSRRDAEALAQWFGSQYSTAAYHAGLGAEERRQIEADWLKNVVQFVVCTSAFGMGVNKPNVRWVAHFQPPMLLSEYLQEIGRGGRDGQTAQALTIVSEPTGWLNPEDKQRTQFFTDRLEKQYQQAQKIVRQLPQQGDLDSVAGRGGEMALALLHSTGQLEWEDPFHYRRCPNITAPLTQLRTRQKQLRSQTARYFTTRQCRWQFLLAAFGLPQEGFQCGHCDNCRRYG